MNKIVRPKNEIVWTLYYNTSGSPVFLLSSKPNREYYIMYEILDDGKLNRLGKSKSPLELEKKYDIEKKCAGNGFGGRRK